MARATTPSVPQSPTDINPNRNLHTRRSGFKPRHHVGDIVSWFSDQTTRSVSFEDGEQHEAVNVQCIMCVSPKGEKSFYFNQSVPQVVLLEEIKANHCGVARLRRPGRAYCFEMLSTAEHEVWEKMYLEALRSAVFYGPGHVDSENQAVPSQPKTTPTQKSSTQAKHAPPATKPAKSSTAPTQKVADATDANISQGSSPISVETIETGAQSAKKPNGSPSKAERPTTNVGTVVNAGELGVNGDTPKASTSTNKPKSKPAATPKQNATAAPTESMSSKPNDTQGKAPAPKTTNRASASASRSKKSASSGSVPKGSAPSKTKTAKASAPDNPTSNGSSKSDESLAKDTARWMNEILEEVSGEDTQG